jgi:hypothetical protein
MLLAGLLCAEVQVFDRDGFHPGPAGPVQQPGERMPDLSIPVICRSRQVVEEPAGLAGRVAVGAGQPRGEVVIVGVHADAARRQGRSQRDDRYGLALPGRGDVPARPGSVVADGVGHRLARLDAASPRLAHSSPR